MKQILSNIVNFINQEFIEKRSGLYHVDIIIQSIDKNQTHTAEIMQNPNAIQLHKNYKTLKDNIYVQDSGDVFYKIKPNSIIQDLQPKKQYFLTLRDTYKGEHIIIGASSQETISKITKATENERLAALKVLKPAYLSP